jgi:hypothetical protein
LLAPLTVSIAVNRLYGLPCASSASPHGRGPPVRGGDVDGAEVGGDVRERDVDLRLRDVGVIVGAARERGRGRSTAGRPDPPPSVIVTGTFAVGAEVDAADEGAVALNSTGLVDQRGAVVLEEQHDLR